MCYAAIDFGTSNLHSKWLPCGINCQDYRKAPVNHKVLHKCKDLLLIVWVLALPFLSSLKEELLGPCSSPQQFSALALYMALRFSRWVLKRGQDHREEPLGLLTWGSRLHYQPYILLTADISNLGFPSTYIPLDTEIQARVSICARRARCSK